MQTSTGTVGVDEFKLMLSRGTNELATFRVTGSCCEGIGIPEGGVIVADLTRQSIANNRDGCVCVCGTEPVTGKPKLMCKEYVGKINGSHIVRTRYTNRTDVYYEADQILGVVCAAYDPQNALLFEINYDEYPKLEGSLQETKDLINTIMNWKSGPTIPVFRMTENGKILGLRQFLEKENDKPCATNS